MIYTFALILCVQVKKVLSNGHYDLKEYTIDMLEEEQQSTLLDRKPYPIYPSKAGLEARVLGQSISRSEQGFCFLFLNIGWEIINVPLKSTINVTIFHQMYSKLLVHTTIV
jgi:hypothetical protein